MNNLTLALDFDGVIADSDSAKLRFARDELGLDVSEEQIKHHYFLDIFGKEKGHRLYQHIIRKIYHSERMLDVPLVSGAGEGLEALRKSGWKCVVVTSRNGSPYIEGSSAYWGWKLMTLNGIEIKKADFINVNESSKLEACLALDAYGLVDDDYSKLAPVIAGGLKGFLFSTKTNCHAEQEYQPFLAERVNGWLELILCLNRYNKCTF
ncbi:MAG: hypothetical protein AB9891_02095 [Anaerolineaceae bacterium]